MAKKKKSKSKFIASRLRFDKTLVLVTMSVLTVAGYLLYAAGRAASIIVIKPPIQYRAVVMYNPVRSSDGVTGTVALCFNNTFRTPYGNATYCYNGARKVGGKFQSRAGFYNTSTKTFIPSTGWMTQLDPFYGANEAKEKGYVPFHYFGKCRGTSIQFYGFGAYATGVGPVVYGEMFRKKTNGNWEQRQGTFHKVTADCNGGTWYPLKAVIKLNGPII
jgi:hypothetical protein